MDRDPYAVIGVARGTSLADAEDAYHRLLRQEHPDLHHGAGPDRVARAESRTRELNAAISAIRDAETIRQATASGAGADGWWTTGAGAGGAAGAWSDGAGPRSDGPGPESARSTWSEPEEARATAPCPWCGRHFDRAVDLKDHVFADHDLRLDRRVRPGLFGGRVGRWRRAAAHLPLWGVIPVNLALALVVGILVAIPTNVTLGRCVFVLALAPTAVAVLDRAFDLSG